MRVLFFVVALLATFYAGYWVIGSSQVERQAEAALARLEAEGWDVSYSALDTSGFPSRFDTTVADLSLASPDGRFAWAAPFFQVFALSYRPNSVIAVWPPEQRLAVGGQEFDVLAEGLRASGTVGLSGDLPLERATIESGSLSLAAEGGWTLALDGLLAAIRRAGPSPGAYDLFLEAEEFRSDAIAADLGLLRLDARVMLSEPLDRRTTVAPQILGLSIRNARLARGDVALAASGDLAPDAQGYLSGTVTLTAENWRGLLDLLAAAGLLVHDQAPFLAGAIEELAQGGDRIEIPITFADGQVQALGVVLLAAPRVF